MNPVVYQKTFYADDLKDLDKDCNQFREQKDVVAIATQVFSHRGVICATIFYKKIEI